MAAKYRFNVSKWRKKLREELVFQVGREDEFRANLKTIKEIRKILARLPKVDFDFQLSATMEKAVTDINAAADQAAQFASMMSRERVLKRKKGGRQLPSTSFMELVVTALELSKGDKDLRHEVRSTLASRFSSTLRPARESIHHWTKSMTKLQRDALPTFYDVSPKAYDSGTQWADQLKSKYLSQIQKRHDRPTPRSPSRRVSRTQALKTVVEKWRDQLA